MLGDCYVVLYTQMTDSFVSSDSSYLSHRYLLTPLHWKCCIFWWTISPRGYHPPSSQCFGILRKIDIVGSTL